MIRNAALALVILASPAFAEDAGTLLNKTREAIQNNDAEALRIAIQKLGRLDEPNARWVNRVIGEVQTSIRANNPTAIAARDTLTVFVRSLLSREGIADPLYLTGSTYMATQGELAYLRAVTDLSKNYRTSIYFEALGALARYDGPSRDKLLEYATRDDDGQASKFEALRQVAEAGIDDLDTAVYNAIAADPEAVQQFVTYGKSGHKNRNRPVLERVWQDYRGRTSLDRPDSVATIQYRLALYRGTRGMLDGVEYLLETFAGRWKEPGTLRDGIEARFNQELAEELAPVFSRAEVRTSPAFRVKINSLVRERKLRRNALEGLVRLLQWDENERAELFAELEISEKTESEKRRTQATTPVNAARLNSDGKPTRANGSGPEPTAVASSDARLAELEQFGADLRAKIREFNSSNHVKPGYEKKKPFDFLIFYFERDQAPDGVLAENTAHAIALILQELRDTLEDREHDKMNNKSIFIRKMRWNFSLRLIKKLTTKLDGAVLQLNDKHHDGRAAADSIVALLKSELPAELSLVDPPQSN